MYVPWPVWTAAADLLVGVVAAGVLAYAVGSCLIGEYDGFVGSEHCVRGSGWLSVGSSRLDVLG